MLAFLAFAASCHEAWRLYMEQPIDVKRDNLAVRYLHCFSVINNGKKLLSTKAPPGNLACLNGLRKIWIKKWTNFVFGKYLIRWFSFVGVLSTTWVVMGHSYSMDTLHTMYNLNQLYNVNLSFFKVLISNCNKSFIVNLI